jgi:hypothetical protein
MKLKAIGIDLAKDVCGVHGVDELGRAPYKVVLLRSATVQKICNRNHIFACCWPTTVPATLIARARNVKERHRILVSSETHLDGGRHGEF